jgi:hypothetical protein
MQTKSVKLNNQLSNFKTKAMKTKKLKLNKSVKQFKNTQK